MGDLLTRLDKAKKATRPPDDEEHPQEKLARQRIIDEAAKAGATLHKPDARGGLRPSLVLGAMRRDGYQCKACGSKERVGPHHKGGIVASPWLSRQGHKNAMVNLTTVCAACHNRLHNDAREAGVDSSQVVAEYDRGDPRRDPSAR